MSEHPPSYTRALREWRTKHEDHLLQPRTDTWMDLLLPPTAAVPQVLSVANNNLTAAPNELSCLTQLTELDLSRNELRALHPALCKLHQLQVTTQTPDYWALTQCHVEVFLIVYMHKLPSTAHMCTCITCSPQQCQPGSVANCLHGLHVSRC